MNIALWVLQSILALAFAGAGAAKLLTSKAALEAKPQMSWAKDFSAPQVKLIGLAQILGAIGLVLPLALSIATWLTPTAATCLAVLMGGAVHTHRRRQEAFALPLLLGLFAALVALGRWVS